MNSSDSRYQEVAERIDVVSDVRLRKFVHDNAATLYGIGKAG
tara:strand:+ start:476 stop:601 length:126 start_codon:yes stop_codon:yes gene_type:complete